MPPRISVVVPCYDDGATVGDAVRSVREAEPVEIVARRRRLARPGDRSRCSTSSPPTARVRLLRQANAGVGAALRAGTAAATRAVRLRPQQRRPRRGAAPWPRWPTRSTATPQHAFAFGWIRFFGDLDALVRQPPWNPWILLHSNRWAISSLYRRDGARRASAASSDSEGYEDWDLLLAPGRRTTCSGVLVPRVVLHYRQHGAERRNRGAMTGLRGHYAALRRRHAALFAREPRAAPPLPAAAAAPASPTARSCASGCSLPGWLVPRLLALKLAPAPAARRLITASRHGQPTRSCQRARGAHARDAHGARGDAVDRARRPSAAGGRRARCRRSPRAGRGGSRRRSPRRP